MARNRSRLDAIDVEYDAIRRQEKAPRVEATEIRSPLDDILHLFARAGFGVEPDEPPRPAARSGRPPSSGDDADDEYFDGFKVLGKRGENG